ncbi:hypothetical protein LEMLEM_LOCUS26947 [Lemmus lemmus]
MDHSLQVRCTSRLQKASLGGGRLWRIRTDPTPLFPGQQQ